MVSTFDNTTCTISELLEMSKWVNAAEEISSSSTSLNGSKLILKAAARRAPVLIFKLLSEKGSSLSETTASGATPLMLAIRHSASVEVLKFLLQNEVNIHQPDKFGRTLLIHATEVHTSIEVISLLLKRGCDVNWKDKYGWSPLMYAARGGAASAEVVKLLLENGSDVNAEDEAGRTALIHACRAYGNNTLEILKWLISYGANVNKETKFGESALYLATNANILNIVSMLVRSGADVSDACSKHTDNSRNSSHSAEMKIILKRARLHKFLLVLCSVRTIPRIGKSSQFRYLPTDLIRRVAVAIKI